MLMLKIKTEWCCFLENLKYLIISVNCGACYILSFVMPSLFLHFHKDTLIYIKPL